jgi:hypothetical protein
MIYPLSRIRNTSFINAYFGLGRECKCLEYLFIYTYLKPDHKNKKRRHVAENSWN